MKKTFLLAAGILLAGSSVVQAQWKQTSTVVSFDGKVGVGTEAPEADIEIRKPNAEVRITATNTADNQGQPSLYINRDTNEGLRLEYVPTVLARISNTYMGELGHITFSTWGHDRMTITGRGQIGIGALPAAKADFELRRDDATMYITAGNSESGKGNPALYINRITEGLRLEYVPNVLARISNTFRDNTGHLALNTNDQDRLFVTGNGNVLIGVSLDGINRANTHKLVVNGTIRSKEVIVDNENWPDYVFENDYDLRPLENVEQFIKKNKHLPEVPSAKEVESNGHKLAEMDALLLKKVEELTLYMIELKKENDRLKEETEAIKQQNRKLNERLSGLEKK